MPHDPYNIDKAEFSDHDMWTRHDALIYRSPRPPVINSSFYPVYQYNDLYSVSILPLIHHIENPSIDPNFRSNLENGFDDVCRPNPTAISEIQRLVGNVRFTNEERSPTTFLRRLAEAMQADVDTIESANPGKTNVILCGGKDSLNLLLLRWSNPTIVLSADPNFALVQKFVEDNALGLEVQRLNDKEDQSLKNTEIAEAGCQVNHGSWKWTPAIKQVSDNFEKNVVFWKGQLGDVYLTSNWRQYSDSRSVLYKKFRVLYRRGGDKFPTARKLGDLVFAPSTVKRLERSIVNRGAVLQGSHMGFLRSICDCLFVSAYHGPQTTSVLHSMHLPSLIGEDIRPALGREIFGQEVAYPTKNPGPPRSTFRTNWRSISGFKEAMQVHGVTI
ncbi:hypothetical protein SAMN04490244_101255 [Tranquillimonas rosea]|uniref:Uncharacterized protein n=1 Tax=Tranquillimonas rosea TaxID=641238 RepID=A0A1H9PMQ0_9RHOB|nr:hypothetical protein [Tranquillimonas rosea]SER49417.1 hypothetical protein SAMN04490244_101255 [Tranquillimonas rosea]